MKHWHGLWLCVGMLALGASSASAHTSKVCWRAEHDGTVTMFAGSYHEFPGLVGGLVIDGTQHNFTGSLSALPPDITACQADCSSTPPIVKWQVVNVTAAPGLHRMTTTSLSSAGNETPWPSCFPATFGIGAPIPTAMTYSGVVSSDPAVRVTVGAIMTPVVLNALVVFTLDGIETCTALVDANGIASCAITPMRPGGIYPLKASFSGMGAIQPSSVIFPFRVHGAPPPPRATTLAWAGDAYVANAEAARLAAVLRGEGGAPVAGRTVQLALGVGARAQRCTGITDASGTASCSVVADQPLDGSAAPATSASFAGDASYLPSAASSEARLQHATGDAYAVGGDVNGLGDAITIARTPDTGHARRAHASTTAAPCVAAVSERLSDLEVLGGEQLCANVSTVVAPGTVAATASIERATLAFGGAMPPIRLTGLAAQSQSGCGGASGQVTIGSLEIDGVSIPLETVAPNTTIELPFGAWITLNEQSPAADAEHGLTVVGAHVVVPPGTPIPQLDLVLASATSAVHNCRPPSSGLVALSGRGPGGGDADGAGDADDPGGCQSTRPGGAVSLAAIALLAARRRRRR